MVEMFTPRETFIWGDTAYPADGQRYAADHPAVKHAPDLFESAGFNRTVEAATAEPGEKR